MSIPLESVLKAIAKDASLGRLSGLRAGDDLNKLLAQLAHSPILKTPIDADLITDPHDGLQSGHKIVSIKSSTRQKKSTAGVE